MKTSAGLPTEAVEAKVVPEAGDRIVIRGREYEVVLVADYAGCTYLELRRRKDG